MLRIRDEQQQALLEPKTELLIERLEAHLREVFPDKTAAYDAEQLRAFVEESVDTGVDLGLTADDSFCRLCDMQFVLGPSFFESAAHPWAAQILGDPTVASANARIDRMAEIAAKL